MANINQDYFGRDSGDENSDSNNNSTPYWPDFYVEALINIVQKKPVIWELKHADHFKRDKVANAWVEVAANMKREFNASLTDSGYKKKFHSLRGQYGKAAKKAKKTCKRSE